MSAPLTRRSVLLACAAVGVAGCGNRGEGQARSGPAPESHRSASPARRPRAGRGRSPLHLAIPVLGLAVPLITLGLNEDGTVEVPAAPHEAGWFRLGTVPGDRGSAVLLGHVDSVDGPAVFADLATMRRKDRVDVVLSDDTLVTFEVTGVETFANADFPAQRVYAGSRRVAGLNLVTCGGEYDRERGGYQSNVVVFTRRTASPEHG